MKIAFFTETWYPNIDGVVVAITDWKKRLEKSGHEIVVFAAGKTKGKKKINGAYIFPSIEFIPYPTYKIAIFPYPDAADLVKEEKIDIIHSHGMGPMGLAALYASIKERKPLIGTLHTNIQEATHYIMPIKPMQKIVKKVAWRYLRWYYNQCDKVIVPSEYMKKECIRNRIKNVEVISNGIDLKFFKPPKKTEKKKRWKEKTVILYTGRLVKEKNLEILIKAAPIIRNKIDNVLFVIVGSGPMEKEYKKMCMKYGVDDIFYFVGSVKREKILQYYYNADVFAFPSMFETQGLSCLEALACGLPVAGADYLAIPDLVKDNYNGYLFKPHDYEGCANAILKCIKNKERLSTNAINSVKDHSIEKSIEKISAIYYKLLNMPTRI